MELRSSGDRLPITSRPDNPTKVFIGENVSLTWSYYQPSHVTLSEVVFGISVAVNYLNPKLVAVNGSGFPEVNEDYKPFVSWAGNLTAYLAVFVLHDVQLKDGNKIFGITFKVGLMYNDIRDRVQLQVQAKHPPRITFVTRPPPVRMGQNVSLNCTASSLLSSNVTGSKDGKVLAFGIFVAVYTLTNITDKAWGYFLCVDRNSDGRTKENVRLKVLPESPTILNTIKTVNNANWTLQWSTIYSEGHLVELYTVWHRVVHVTNNMTREEPWLQENITGFMYHKELTADTSYVFAVTAWNKWGESLLERGKMLSITTDFQARTIKKMVSTEPRTSVSPSDSSNKHDSSENTKAILYGVITAALCILFLAFMVSYCFRRTRNRRNQNNNRNIELTGTTAFSFTSSQDDITSEAAQETANEARSVILTKSSSSMEESSLTLEQSPTHIRSMLGNGKEPRTGECLEMSTTIPGSNSQEVFISLNTFYPPRGSTKSERNQEIHIPVLRTPSREQRNKVTMTTDAATTVLGAISDGAVVAKNQETKKNEALGSFRPKENVIDTIQRVASSEGYLQLVDNNNLQAGISGKARLFSLNHPQVNTGRQLELAQSNTDKLQNNLLYEREAPAQHCSTVRPAHQSNRLISPAMADNNDNNNNNNNRSTTTPYSVESPYMKVLQSTNWEVSRDHLSLLERIGGGSFGQVWKGAVFDVAGDKEWSVVAVKMLKENSSSSDLKDLLSELNLLKKLKPHPNVIHLLGCLTKDVIRCKGRREFRPPLVILEFVPHGDLLGYLRKSKGQTDDYYNLRGADVPRKIPTRQLYKFASDIARGMEFISAHQLIHRDLAARNVLVGEGLRCKITDFDMTRDLGRNDMYVKRPNEEILTKE